MNHNYILNEEDLTVDQIASLCGYSFEAIKSKIRKSGVEIGGDVSAFISKRVVKKFHYRGELMSVSELDERFELSKGRFRYHLTQRKEIPYLSDVTTVVDDFLASLNL